MDKKSFNQREKDNKKRGDGRKFIDNTAPGPRTNEGVCPNLMLWSKDGSVQAEVNVFSADGVSRMAAVVAESVYGSDKLSVVSDISHDLGMDGINMLIIFQNSARGQSLRVFAISTEGSVHAHIPSTFEGALFMITEYGKINISEVVEVTSYQFLFGQ
jgi:hypothetical protein